MLGCGWDVYKRAMNHGAGNLNPLSLFDVCKHTQS